MRPPIMLVLFTALAHSTFGVTSEETADHDIIADTVLKHHIFNYHYPTMIAGRTNIDNNNYYNIENNIDKSNIPHDHPIVTTLEIHRRNVKRLENRKQHAENKDRYGRVYDKEVSVRRVKRQEDDQDPKCEDFSYTKDKGILSPKDGLRRNTYPNNTNCVTIINGTSQQSIKLTFVDVFHIEYHPDCAYDYLEIRDGSRGYADLLGKYCGESFPQQIVTSGPFAWLKFHSDDTIEYEGFHIDVQLTDNPSSLTIPDVCYIKTGGTSGTISTKDISDCYTAVGSNNLDVLWTIETESSTKIYLNFTRYALASPNECEQNVIQVFGSILEYEAKFAQYCGSVAETISTKGDGIKDKGNLMYVRLYASKNAKKNTDFEAKYTAYRTLDPSKDEKCAENEFDCEDNTCIDINLKCNDYANCRLKTDEEAQCNLKSESILKQPHIQVVLVIFSLILSSMSFVFLFRCIRKLYQDHKIIKEHIRQSCEDRLDNLVASRLTLDAKKLQRDSEPRASLERDNHTNEMYKKQRTLSRMKPSSIDSDFIQETQLDQDDENWRHDVECVPEIVETDGVRIEHNGRARRSDLSKREESIRSKIKETDEDKSRKEIRDVSVGAPDTKESGCQTRESLFQVESPTAPSSDGSGSNSRGFSTFGYSGTTIVRPSPPAPSTNTSQITIELLKQASHDSNKSKKKVPDRRPMSTETTRSAPDVIIVSKPLR